MKTFDPDVVLSDFDRRRTLLIMVRHGKYEMWSSTMGGLWAHDLVRSGLAVLAHQVLRFSDEACTKKALWCTWKATPAAHEWLA